MKARLLPLDGVEEMAVLLTLSRAEAREIMEELTGTALAHSARPEELSHNARKLYELLEIVSVQHTTQTAQDLINTDGRTRPAKYALTGDDLPRPQRSEEVKRAPEKKAEPDPHTTHLGAVPGCPCDTCWPWG